MKTTIHNYFSLKNKATKYRDNRTKLLCRSIKDDNMYLQNKIQNSSSAAVYTDQDQMHFYLYGSQFPTL